MTRACSPSRRSSRRLGRAGALVGGAILAAALGTGAGIGAELGAGRQDALRDLLVQDCGSCHGMTLKGGLGRALTPEAVADRTAAALADIILDGVPGTPMPPWRGLLSEEEARYIAELVKRGLKP